jgi:tetratricopeptide (TPR) repeat protein/HEAT repeat protein
MPSIPSAEFPGRRYRRPVRSPSLFRSLFLPLALGLTTALVAPSGMAQDFNPHGRHKPTGGKPTGGKPTGGKPTGNGGKPTGTGPTEQANGTAEAERTTKLIERYTKVVLGDPGNTGPLQKLAQLYRDRDGKIDALVKDFETKAAAGGTDGYGAIVGLAGVYRIDGCTDLALSTFDKAIADKPSNPAAHAAKARLLQDRGDATGSRTAWEKALSVQTNTAEKGQILRTLMTLCLDQKDWDAAKKFHTDLVKSSGRDGTLYVKGELARALFQVGEYDRAEAEFQVLARESAGDNRTLAPVLKELGEAQLRAKKYPEALATLNRALGTAGREASVRNPILRLIADVYRAEQKLPEFVTKLEADHASDFDHLALLGGIYEETGDVEKAMATYKKALGQNPRDIDLRLKMVRLLQSQGELDKAITEYEALVRAAPNNPTFVFEECEALLARGDRARALKLLTELEARGGSDEDTLGRLADFYGRIGENARGTKVLERLASSNGNDPSHLADLGDRYFAAGNEALALATWRRILTAVTPRARALSALADVYLEHDKAPDALVAVKEAVSLDPNSAAYKKQLAAVHERLHNFSDARNVWLELDKKAKESGDKLLAREARTRIVSLWGQEKILDAQVPRLNTAFHGKPADVDAGRLLAEVQIRLQKPADAEATLREVTTLAPGDTEAYLALERVLVQQNKLEGAIAALEKLAAVDPKQARQVYQRMAGYALQTYKDADAIRYAAKAVELNPDDAEGHRKLGDLYRQRQDTDHAIAAYKKALEKNDRLFLVYFQLADLLLTKGDTDEADRLLRKVLRGAPDDELVARASRLSAQINLGRGSIETLEQELVPLALANPGRPLYRKLLVEIYGQMSFGLVQKARLASGDESKKARETLEKVGSRAIKPLLDALADPDASQQRTAIAVLGYVRNKNAAPALFSYAEGAQDPDLRVRAMLACGALGESSLVPRYDALIFPKIPGEDAVASADRLAVAAAWAATSLDDKRARPLQERLLDRGTPEMKAFAAIAFARQGDKQALPRLTKTLQASDSGSAARAAAAWAIGSLSEGKELALVEDAARGADPLVAELALASLATKGHGKAELFADTLFFATSGGPRSQARAARLRDASALGLARLAGKNVQSAPSSVPWGLPGDGVLDADAFLDALAATPLTDTAFRSALVTHGAVIEASAKHALATGGVRARAVLEAFGPTAGTFLPALHGTSEDRAVVEPLLARLLPELRPYTTHDDPALRAQALALVARIPGRDASATLAAALAGTDGRELTGDEADTRKIALGVLASAPREGADLLAPAMLAATKSTDWTTRLAAAKALGTQRISSPDAVARLSALAVDDPFALVREGALLALSAVDPGAGKKLATTRKSADPEARVRATAASIAGK